MSDDFVKYFFKSIVYLNGLLSLFVKIPLDMIQIMPKGDLFNEILMTYLIINIFFI